MLSVVMLNAVMLNVVVLNVMAPTPFAQLNEALKRSSGFLTSQVTTTSFCDENL